MMLDNKTEQICPLTEGNGIRQGSNLFYRVTANKKGRTQKRL